MKTVPDQFAETHATAGVKHIDGRAGERLNGPCSTVNEVNSPAAKASAAGAMHFLVFVLSAFAAGAVFIGSIVLALLLALLLQETGPAAQPAR